MVVSLVVVPVVVVEAAVAAAAAAAVAATACFREIAIRPFHSAFPAHADSCLNIRPAR